MTCRKDLTIYQGDDFTASLQVTAADGTVQDLTGYGVAAQIRMGFADDEEEVVADLNPTITEPETGLIGLSVPSAITTGMNGRYVWDIQLTSPDGIVTTVLWGDVITIQEVTR